MDDSLAKVGNFDEISRNISKNLEELNDILKNSKIECKVLDNNLNVAEILCYKFDDLVINQGKTDMYDLEAVDALFTKFKKKKKRSGSTMVLNEIQESEIEKILLEIKSVLNSIENSKFLDINADEIEKKTDDARNKFHNLSFDLEKINRNLKIIVDSRKSRENCDNSANTINQKINEELVKINKVTTDNILILICYLMYNLFQVLQDLQFVKSNQNLVKKADKNEFDPLLSSQVDSLIDVMEQNI